MDKLHLHFVTRTQVQCEICPPHLPHLGLVCSQHALGDHLPWRRHWLGDQCFKCDSARLDFTPWRIGAFHCARDLSQALHIRVSLGNSFWHLNYIWEHYMMLASLFSPRLCDTHLFVFTGAEHHINANSGVTTMLDKREKARNKKKRQLCWCGSKRAQRECKPEQILMMTQLSNSQMYVVKYWGRKLKVIVNRFCENQHHLLLSFIHSRNSKHRLLLDDLLLPALRFTYQQVNEGITHFFPLKTLQATIFCMFLGCYQRRSMVRTCQLPQTSSRWEPSSDEMDNTGRTCYHSVMNGNHNIMGRYLLSCEVTVFPHAP